MVPPIVGAEIAVRDSVTVVAAALLPCAVLRIPLIGTPLAPVTALLGLLLIPLLPVTLHLPSALLGMLLLVLVLLPLLLGVLLGLLLLLGVLLGLLLLLGMLLLLLLGMLRLALSLLLLLVRILLLFLVLLLVLFVLLRLLNVAVGAGSEEHEPCRYKDEALNEIHVSYPPGLFETVASIRAACGFGKMVLHMGNGCCRFALLAREAG